MLKVTGLLLNNQSGLVIPDNPSILLVPNLQFAGKLNCDANIYDTLIEQQKGSIGYTNIEMPQNVLDAYNTIINFLDVYVKAELEKIPFNQQNCTIEIVDVPQKIEENNLQGQ